jgi:thymidylate synthase (FAD)
MQVRLVSYSQPTEEFRNQGIEDAQDLIAFCARVSNPSNQYNTETSERLISYLVEHAHWSPLELVSACVEIDTPRDVARQILRHRSFSFQEFSARYSDPTKALSMEPREARLQDKKNRQNSIELDLNDDSHRELARMWLQKQQEVIRLTRSVYEWAVNNDIAKEVARAVLPEGLMGSRMYINGTIRSYIHYIQVRTDESTQKEHREIAREIAKAIASIFPMTTSFVGGSTEE